MQRVELLTGAAREPVPEHDAVQVIGLVLQATSQQARTHYLNLFAVLVKAATDGVVRPS